MKYDPGGLVAVDAAVLGECVGEQFMGVGLAQVGLPIALGDLGGASPHDYAVATLVEDPGDGGVQSFRSSKWIRDRRRPGTRLTGAMFRAYRVPTPPAGAGCPVALKDNSSEE